jgi:hypothetical protein
VLDISHSIRRERVHWTRVSTVQNKIIYYDTVHFVDYCTINSQLVHGYECYETAVSVASISSINVIV